MVPAGEGLVQLQVADDVAQGGGGQVLDGSHGVFHPVGIQLGVGDLEVDHGINLHGDVVFGDDGLGREIHHLLLQRDIFRHPLKDRHLEVQAHSPNSAESAQALDDKGTRLGYDLHVGPDDNQNQRYDNQPGQNAQNHLHIVFFLSSPKF